METVNDYRKRPQGRRIKFKMKSINASKEFKDYRDVHLKDRTIYENENSGG